MLASRSCRRIHYHHAEGLLSTIDRDAWYFPKRRRGIVEYLQHCNILNTMALTALYIGKMEKQKERSFLLLLFKGAIDIRTCIDTRKALPIELSTAYSCTCTNQEKEPYILLLCISPSILGERIFFFFLTRKWR